MRRNAPELPLWQPPHEWPELIVPLTGEDGLGSGGIALLYRVGEEILSQGGVKLGLQECEEEVEEVDGVGVCGLGVR